MTVTEIDYLKQQIEAASKGPVKGATVVAVDRTNQRVSVQVQTDEGTAVWPNVPLFGDYLPEVGQATTLMISGRQVVAAPSTQSIITGSRGRFETTGGNNLYTSSLDAQVELLYNGTFEQNIDGWGATGGTLAQTGAQFHSGTKSLQITSTAGGTVTTKVANSISFLAAVQVKKWYRCTFWMRTAVTARSITGRIEWLDSALNVLSTTTKVIGNDSAASWLPFIFYGGAPTSAVYARVSVDIAATAAAEVHYLDDVSFHEAVPGFDASTNAKVFTFDGGTEAFVGVSASVAQNTGANPAPVAGLGMLQCTATAATAFGATSATGLSAIPVTVGFNVAVSGWCRAKTTSRTCTPTILWYTAAGAANGTTSGTAVTSLTSEWTEFRMTAVAPANTAFYAIRLLTNTGVIGEVMYMDVVLGTQPTNTNIFVNVTGAHVRTGTGSMGMQAIANGVANVIAPPGDDATYAWPVTPGDYYDVDFYYKNEPANPVRRAAFTVASWYASNGGFIGTQLGTFPVTSPGSSFNPASETFLVPAGVAYMRINIVWLAAAGDVLYIDDVFVRKVSVLSGKFLAQGSIDPIDIRYISNGADGTSTVVEMASPTAGAWTAATAQKIPNPMQPVRVMAMATAYVSGTTTAVVSGRVGISMDNGLSWRYGALEKMSSVPVAGFPAPQTFMSIHQVTGMPTDDILYRVEYNPSAAVDIVNLAQWSLVVPAPPAGKQ